LAKNVIFIEISEKKQKIFSKKSKNRSFTYNSTGGKLSGRFSIFAENFGKTVKTLIFGDFLPILDDFWKNQISTPT